jgi:uncharacterized protein YjbI with pentapeptide repeats
MPRPFSISRKILRMSEKEKPKLKPSNENAWYCLATVYGEQEGKGDENLAKQNRMAWNRWMAVALSQEQRAELLKKGVDELELTPLKAEERVAFLKAFATRTIGALPDPSETVDFRGVHFERPAPFGGFIFPTDALFDGAAFDQFAGFLKTVFLRNAIFHKTVFSDMAYFHGTAFADMVSFLEATFSSHFFFKDATVSGLVFFTKATGFGRADFSGTSFSRLALFSQTIFHTVADFKNVKFLDDASFDQATFANNVFFGNSIFAGAADFSGAEFAGIADFISCEFKSHTSFVGAKFKACVPAFFDTRLPEAIVWGKSEWPLPSKDTNAALQQAVAYERLKAEMDRLNRHVEAQFFFAKELRAQREGEPSYSPQRAFNFAYQILGFYGASAELPILWLWVLFVLGFGFFALVPVYKSAPLGYDEAAGLSFTNLISFLPYKPNKEIFDGLSPIAKIIGDLQSLLGVILLFLLGLALRNRFRMK